MARITPAQFQEYQQQWNQPVEDGDAEGQRQKLNAAFWVACCYWYEYDDDEAQQILNQAIQDQNGIDGDNHHDNTGKHRYLLAWMVRDQVRSRQLYHQAFPRLELEVQIGGNGENHQEAAFYLGKCLFFGYGVDKDEPRGIHWLKVAAELGHREAQSHIERNCFREPFVAEIFSWLQQIADQSNNAWAQGQLGRCHEKGCGVEDDLVKAVEWYNKAIAQGYNRATRDKQWLLQFLTPEERSKTLGCVARNQKIGKARDLIQQSFVGAVPLSLWSHALASFQNQENPPWEAPSPTFLALSNGIMQQLGEQLPENKKRQLQSNDKDH